MKLKGFIYAIISAVFFGSAGIFIKNGYNSNFSPVDLLMLQYIIATFILFFMCFIRHRKSLILTRDTFRKLLIQGAIGNTFMTVFFYSSFKYLNVAVATMLLYTYPAVAAMINVMFLKRKLSPLKLFSIVGTFIGCIFVMNIFSVRQTINILGIACALLSACFYAFMNIYAEKIVDDVPSVVITLYTTIFSLIVLIFFNFSFIGKLNTLSSQSLLNAALLAFFCEIIPLTLLYEAIKYIGSVSTSIISTLELPSAAILAFLFLSEKINALQISGAVIVILCVVMLKKEKES